MSHASLQKVRVVHSSVGRLRVHVPNVGGDLAAQVRRLPGVTYAEANELTENILILFSPQQLSESVLLAEIHALCVNPLAVLPALLPEHANLSQDDDGASPVDYVTGLQARLYKVLGWTSVGMAVVGAITPGIPTVPFVLLAGYFFIRSSPAAHEWLQQSNWFGPTLRDWEEHQAVKRTVKYAAVGLMGAGLTISWLIGLPTPVFAAIVVLEIIGLVIVLRLREVEAASSSPAPAVTALIQ